MKKLFLFLSLLLLLTCAKEDSQAPNTPPTQIVKQYTLTTSAGEGGSVSGGGTFSQGTQVSLTATPTSGYSFSGWSTGSTANPLTVTLNSNTSVTANFQVIVNSYTLTVTAGEGGTVSGGGDYEEGTEVTITASPDEGYNDSDLYYTGALKKFVDILEKDIEIKYTLLSLGNPEAFNNTIFEVKKIKLTQKKVQKLNSERGIISSKFIQKNFYNYPSNSDLERLNELIDGLKKLEYVIDTDV
ncbi:MAG: hypothetical protein H8E16_07380, partial [Flavobacteriales bacterium]|nr:hypothetical protein [Flavobacteriales bacterium]